MRGQISKAAPGFTLVEAMLCVAIIALLAGLIYAGLAPARERAREAYCINNFHQIARAIRIYRDDYGGQDPPGTLTYAQLGLPREPRLLIPYLGGSWAVFHCPSEHWGVLTGGPSGSGRLGSANPNTPVSYIWQIWPDGLWRSETRLKQFSERVALRGDDTPLLLDPHHGGLHDGEATNVRFIILRLGGQVQDRVLPRLPQADWAL